MVSKREITVAGESLWLCGMTGTVAGEKKWSETRVQSTAGNAYVHSTISTNVSTRHEFWLVGDDGEERCVELGNSKVAVREGQKMTAIWGAGSSIQTGPFLMLRNNSAQTDTWLISDAKSLLVRMKLSDPTTKFALIGAGVGVLLLFMMRGPKSLVFFLLAALGGYAYGTYQRMEKAKAVKQAAFEAMNLEVQGQYPARDIVSGGGAPRLVG